MPMAPVTRCAPVSRAVLARVATAASLGLLPVGGRARRARWLAGRGAAWGAVRPAPRGGRRAGQV